ncbi:hypothetical protein [Zoogloea sp.]|uniref:hypothetical protein n=1 Tax=Zoogloea sp. TaxID=49181 RepID=UPI002630A65C|nr:hypothetical protein [Zoogloea sp.]
MAGREHGGGSGVPADDGRQGATQSAEAGQQLTATSATSRLAQRGEALGNGIAAVALLLKISDQAALEKLMDDEDCGSPLEPLGYLVEMLANEVFDLTDRIRMLS